MAKAKLEVDGLLVTIVFLALIILSLSFIAAPYASSHHGATPKLALAVKSYQQLAPALPGASAAKVLALETQQPAPETWQGPIEPLPSDPNHPSLPILTQIPTSEPVVFLGIDDGWVHNPATLVWLTQHHLPFSMFLTDNGIKTDYGYFQQLQAAGLTVEDHTLSHPDLTRLTLGQQKTEICGAADTYSGVFGARPTLFRPPYGKANQLTLQAATECGMRAVVMWHALIQNGAFQYQDGQSHLLPGDIVLMHFTNIFPADIQTFMNQINADHLQVAKLEDWIP